MQRILATVRGFDGVLELAPTPGSAAPEIPWGDHFFYYAPDGQVPQGQPYATIVTKDYPGEPVSNLDPPERWRLNIHVGKAGFTELIGEDPAAETSGVDFSAADTLLPHPVYRTLGWIAIVNPGVRTSARAIELLRQAHDDAKRRTHRRRSHSVGEA